MFCSVKRIINYSKKQAFRSSSDQFLCRHFSSNLENANTLSEQNSNSSTLSRPPSFGQPTGITHPHMLKKRELLPGMLPSEFINRRKAFMNLLFLNLKTIQDTPKYHVAIIPSASKTFMTEKIPYVFRQNSNFLYLTGCLEPDTLLVITGIENEDITSTLFLRKPDAKSELWDGPKTGADVAVEMFGVDQAFYVDTLGDFLLRNVTKNPDCLVYYDPTNKSSLNNVINSIIQQTNIKSYTTGAYFLHQLRLIKSPAEQNLMREAGLISAEAIAKTIQITKPGITEHQLYATVDYESRMRGAKMLAYPPVVAAGNNANIIHYIDNNQEVKAGDLILMDAGCEHYGYCGDITRTWPANGKFTKYQKILYEIVLEIQKEIISLCNERMSVDFMYYRMLSLLSKYLKSENIIKEELSNSEVDKIVSDLCPHRVSHYLGMDVHDSGSCNKNIPLKPGMIVTVEPGLYIKENDSNVPPEFWKMGIRIEDDILITETGYEVLSLKCPKEVNDIENLIKTA